MYLVENTNATLTTKTNFPGLPPPSTSSPRTRPQREEGDPRCHPTPKGWQKSGLLSCTQKEEPISIGKKRSCHYNRFYTICFLEYL